MSSRNANRNFGQDTEVCSRIPKLPFDWKTVWTARTTAALWLGYARRMVSYMVLVTLFGWDVGYVIGTGKLPIFAKYACEIRNYVPVLLLGDARASTSQLCLVGGGEPLTSLIVSLTKLFLGLSSGIISLLLSLILVIVQTPTSS